MINISNDGAVVRNTGTQTGAPAVRISGDNVSFTNADSGRVFASSDGVAAILIEGAGAVVVNELGGIIRATGDDELAIVGSAFGDTVVNEGLIVGSISLGGGADSYTHRVASWSHASLIDFGAGNDVYRYEADTYFVQAAFGGGGTDRVILAGELLQIDATYLSGFERLEVGADVVNIQNFSGYSQVLLAPGGAHNFLDSANPDADLVVAGGGVTVGPGSVFRNITGTGGVEAVEVGASIFGKFGTILGDVELGGGDDFFQIFWQGEGPAPTVAGMVDGGPGSDLILINVDGGHTIDLSNLVGFENVNTGTYSSVVTDVRLIHAEGYESIQADEGVLRIAETDAPQTNVRQYISSTIVLEATATVGSVGKYEPGLENQAQADDFWSFEVTNAGTVVGDVWMYIGDDLYDGRSGSVGGTIFGYAGNDTLLGGAGPDRLDGGFGADDLQGGGGADQIRGGGGADRLKGGAGADDLDGGLGADLFLYSAVGDSAGAAADTINGFQTGLDKIDLREVLASSVGWDAAGAAVLVTIETTTGTMNLTVNGAISLDDFLLPQGMVLGTAGADNLIGTSAADRFDGGLGADTMTGLAGNDTYRVENAGDRAVEAAGEGVDTVESAVSFTLGDHVERLILTGSAASGGTGNSLNNVIIGNAASNVLRGGAGGDTLNGGGGDDSLDGGTGADVMNGGAGNDTYTADNSGDKAIEASAAGGIDLVKSSASFVLGAHLENLTLTGTAVQGSGNALANILTGNAAANVLNGGGGADTMNGWAGNDTYHVDHAGDRVVETRATGGTDTVSSSISFTLGANLENLTLTGNAANGTGNALANILTGNAAANVLRGGAGNDVLKGGGGTDRLHGGDGSDTLRGGDGGDRFVFDKPLGPSNVDHLGDFVRGADKIVLENAVFKGLAAGPLAAGAFVVGAAAADAGDRIIYNPATGALLYDPDGTGAAAATQFAVLDTLPASLAASDFLVI